MRVFCSACCAVEGYYPSLPDEVNHQYRIIFHQAQKKGLGGVIFNYSVYLCVQYGA